MPPAPPRDYHRRWAFIRTPLRQILDPPQQRLKNAWTWEDLGTHLLLSQHGLKVLKILGVSLQMVHHVSRPYHKKRGGKGGSCHEVMIVNFWFHESRNKKFTSVKFTKVMEKIWSQCSEIQLLTCIFSRFTAKDFCISRLTEYTSITVNSQNRFLSNHDSQRTKNRITDIPDHGVTKIPLLPVRTKHKINMKLHVCNSKLSWAKCALQHKKRKKC